MDFSNPPTPRLSACQSHPATPATTNTQKSIFYGILQQPDSTIITDTIGSHIVSDTTITTDTTDTHIDLKKYGRGPGPSSRSV